MKLTPTEIVRVAVIGMFFSAAVIAGFQTSADDGSAPVSKTDMLEDAERLHVEMQLKIAIWRSTEEPCVSPLVLTRDSGGRWLTTCVGCEQALPDEWLPGIVDGFESYSKIARRETFRFRDFAVWVGWCEE